MSRGMLMIGLLLATGAVQAAEIAAGPMPGHSAMRQAKVWVQTDEPAEIELRYWVEGQSEETAMTGRSTRGPKACMR